MNVIKFSHKRTERLNNALTAHKIMKHPNAVGLRCETEESIPAGAAHIVGVGSCLAYNNVLREGKTTIYAYPTDARLMVAECIRAGYIPADKPPMADGKWPSVDEMLALIQEQ